MSHNKSKRISLLVRQPDKTEFYHSLCIRTKFNYNPLWGNSSKLLGGSIIEQQVFSDNQLTKIFTVNLKQTYEISKTNKATSNLKLDKSERYQPNLCIMHVLRL